MNERKLKLLSSLLKKLDEALEKQTDITFEERPFLSDKNIAPEILPQNERRKENKIEIKKIIEAILNL